MHKMTAYSRRATDRRWLGLLLVSIAILSYAGIGRADCFRAEQLYQQSERDVLQEERLLEQVLDQCPEHAAALNNLGVLRENQGRLNEAASLFERAVVADRYQPAPYAGLGDVRRKQGDYTAAVRAYEQFLDTLQGAKRMGDLDNLGRHEAEYRRRLDEVRSKLQSAEVGSQAVIGRSEIERVLTSEPMVARGIGGHYKKKAHIHIPIHFDFNSAQIREDSMGQIAEIAGALRARVLSSAEIMIEGHTDSRGSKAYNQELSERRAEAVRAVLVEQFEIPRHRLQVEGFGETRPVADNGAETGRAENRRVTFVNLGDL